MQSFPVIFTLHSPGIFGMVDWPVLQPRLHEVRNLRTTLFAITSWLPSASNPGSIVAYNMYVRTYICVLHA